MKKEIVFATSNSNKVSEVSALLGDKYLLRSLKDIGILEEIPETAHTLEGNAKLKAQYVFDKKGLDCFSEDTGLEIESLDNEPGVRSARYAGLERSDSANMEKVLHLLKGKKNRNARFRTVIALVEEGKIKTFEGIVKGRIAEMPVGQQGFGYDPIFIPEGFSHTFAEMSKKDKNQISHRGRAIQKLIEYLHRQ